MKAARDITWLMNMVEMENNEAIASFTEEERSFVELRQWVDSLPQHSGKDDGLTPHQRLEKIIPIMDKLIEG